MLGYSLPLALLGLGVLTRAAPTVPRSNDAPNPAPPGCVGWVWDMVHICIVSPPTTTIGPSTKRRGVDDSYPTGCIPLILEEWNLCILAPPTTTITPSSKRDEPAILVNRDNITPTPTSDGGCIPIILQEFNICIVAPPTTTIVPSNKKHKRDWFGLGPPTVGGLVPDKTIPGGALVPDHYIPGGGLVPDVPVPGGEITPST